MAGGAFMVRFKSFMWWFVFGLVKRFQIV